MSKLVNIDAEVGANIIDDDTNPTLTLTNTSTGAGLETNDLVVSSNATIQGANLTAPRISTPTLVGQSVIHSTATTTRAALVNRTTYGNASTALMAFGVSGASVPVFEFLGHAFTSCVSIVFAASANWAGMGAVKVKLSDDTTFGWIPILPDGVVTAATYS